MEYLFWKASETILEKVSEMVLKSLHYLSLWKENVMALVKVEEINELIFLAVIANVKVIAILLALTLQTLDIKLFVVMRPKAVVYVVVVLVIVRHESVFLYPTAVQVLTHESDLIFLLVQVWEVL
jgi:hypothetical protein